MPGLESTFGVQHEWRQSPLWHVPKMLPGLAASASPGGSPRAGLAPGACSGDTWMGPPPGWHSGWLGASLQPQDIWGHRGSLLAFGGLQQLCWWLLLSVSPTTVFQPLIYSAHGKGNEEMSARQLCYHKDGISVRKELKMILISAYLLQVMYARFFSFKSSNIWYLLIYFRSLRGQRALKYRLSNTKIKWWAQNKRTAGSKGHRSVFTENCRMPLQLLLLWLKDVKV